MQPKRDPNDRRYWPARKGGTGQGFTQHGKEASSHHYGALERNGSLSLNPRNVLSSMVQGNTVEDFDGASKHPTAATRERARLILDRALDRMGKAIDDAKPLTVNEIAGAVNALAKVSGVTSIVVEHTGSVAHLHLAALQAPRITAIAQVDDTHALSNVSEDAEHEPYTEPVQGE